MKKIILLFTAAFAFLLVSCGEYKPNYKVITSLDKKYSVEVPDYTRAYKCDADFISFTSKSPDLIISVQQVPYNDLSTYIGTIDFPEVYDYLTIANTDSTCFFRVTKGTSMFSAYELYHFVKADNRRYIIKVTSAAMTQTEVLSVEKHVSASFKNLQQSTISKADAKADMKSFSNQWYSIKYPSTWQVVNNLNEMTEVYIGSQSEDLGFTVVRFETDESLNSIISEGNQELRNAGGKILSENMCKVGGVSCIMQFQILSISGITGKHLSYSMKKGNMFYNFKFGNVTSDERMELCNKVIETLKIK